MAQKRVHEIAKERGMSSKDVLLKLRAAGMDVTAAAAEVDEAEALRALASNGTARPGGPQRPAAQAPAQQKPAPPAGRARRPAPPRDGEAAARRSRRVFEPDGPPLQVQPRGRQQGYVPPPPPGPRPRPSAEPAAGTRPAPRAGEDESRQQPQGSA